MKPEWMGDLSRIPPGRRRRSCRRPTRGTLHQRGACVDRLTERDPPRPVARNRRPLRPVTLQRMCTSRRCCTTRSRAPTFLRPLTLPAAVLQRASPAALLPRPLPAARRGASTKRTSRPARKSTAVSGYPVSRLLSPHYRRSGTDPRDPRDPRHPRRRRRSRRTLPDPRRPLCTPQGLPRPHPSLRTLLVPVHRAGSSSTRRRSALGQDGRHV